MRALVLKKTKLAEKDLIVTVLNEQGALVQCVAKGARKPGSTLAARLELFSLADLLIAEGRSLDIVCEARLSPRENRSSYGLTATTCSAPIAELLCRICQPQLEAPRLFALSCSAFDHVSQCEEDEGRALLTTAAGLWKIMAQSGFRPSFSRCVVCGKGISHDDRLGNSLLSYAEGGCICEQCPRPADAQMVSDNVVAWCESLIASRFDEIFHFECDVRTTFEILQIARFWVRVHTGHDLKSLDFLFTSGLF